MWATLVGGRLPSTRRLGAFILCLHPPPGPQNPLPLVVELEEGAKILKSSTPVMSHFTSAHISLMRMSHMATTGCKTVWEM